VEKVASGLDDQDRVRELYLAIAPSFASWHEALSEASLPRKADEGFALLLIADASVVDTDTVCDLATFCINNGVFSVSSWGPDCERVHDTFDEVDVELRFLPQVDSDEPFEGVVMTTWHAKESLAEALEYFWTCTFNSDGRSWGPTWTILVIGNAGWADEVRSLVRSALPTW
jgi:hypothetical protein